MEITPLFKVFAELPNLLPTRFSSENEQEKIQTVWNRMIIDGDGFISKENGTVLQISTISYLKNQKCSGNFISFSQHFCKEILADNFNNPTALQKDRIFTIFKTLAQGYIEKDQWGVREYSPTFGKMYKKIKFSFSLQTYKQISEIFYSYLKEFCLPWSLSTIPVALSRYRTTQQCYVGIKSVADKLGLDETGVRTKANELTSASVARCSAFDKVVSKDPLLDIGKIKSLQAHRIASTAIRVALVALSLFVMIKIGIFLLPFLEMCEKRGLLVDVVFLAIFIVVGVSFLVINHFQLKGTLLEAFGSAASLLLKLVTILECGFFGVLPICILSLVSTHPVALLFLAVSSIIFYFQKRDFIENLDIIPKVTQKLSRFLEKHFYEKDFNEDSIKPVVDFFAKAIETVLDPIVSRI